MSNNLHYRKFSRNNRVLINKHHYSVTITITKFVWVELNRVAHKDFIDTKFDDFGQGLVTDIFKACIFAMGMSGECIVVRLIIISIGLPFSSFGILGTRNIIKGSVLFSISLSYAAEDLFHKIAKLVDKSHRQVLI